MAPGGRRLPRPASAAFGPGGRVAPAAGDRLYPSIRIYGWTRCPPPQPRPAAWTPSGGGWSSSPIRPGSGRCAPSRSRSSPCSSSARSSRSRSRPSRVTSRCSPRRAGSPRAVSDGWAVLRQDAERLAAVKARRDGAQRFFAGAAGAWDRLRAEVYGAALGTEALLSLLPSEWTVADLGCGTGAVAADLAPRFRKVVAVDQSGEMLRAARRRLAGLSNVELHEARLEALPLADASCDAVLAVLVLSYLEDPGAALREAERVLRPGGRLVVVEAARHADEALRRRMGQRIPGFEASALAALLPGGLVDRTARALPPEPGAKGPGLVVATARRKSR